MLISLILYSLLTLITVVNFDFQMLLFYFLFLPLKIYLQIQIKLYTTCHYENCLYEPELVLKLHSCFPLEHKNHYSCKPFLLVPDNKTCLGQSNTKKLEPEKENEPYYKSKLELKSNSSEISSVNCKFICIHILLFCAESKT